MTKINASSWRKDRIAILSEVQVGSHILRGLQICRCDVCECGQDDGHETVSEQGVQRITSKSKEETAQT